MKEFLIIVVGWLCWFFIFSPLISNSAKANVDGNYTSDSMYENMTGGKQINEVENLDIKFKNGIYYIKYDLYSKCEKYYPDTNTCADNIRTFQDSIDNKGSYTIEGDKLILKIDGNTRTCTFSDSEIDCTASGGWLYKKE